jgi:hypothetical protein
MVSYTAIQFMAKQVCGTSLASCLLGSCTVHMLT